MSSTSAELSDLRLVCFDLGGVVVRIRRNWSECCRAVGLEIREDALLKAAEEDFLGLNQAYQRGEMPVEVYAQRVSDLVDGIYGVDEVLRMHRAILDGQYEGMGDLVDRIHGAGLETAILSNTCGAHWPYLLEYPAVAKIPVRVASHLIGVAKPDPQAYGAVERATGQRGPSIIFFDDTLANVEAAREYGWRSEVIDYTQPTAPQVEARLCAGGIDLP